MPATTWETDKIVISTTLDKTGISEEGNLQEDSEQNECMITGSCDISDNQAMSSTNIPQNPMEKESFYCEQLSYATSVNERSSAELGYM